MDTRLEFATEAEAQACADAIHLKLQAADPAYAKSVANGWTTAWAIPYLSEKTLVWCVNVKDRGALGIETNDAAKLKPVPKDDVVKEFAKPKPLPTEPIDGGKLPK